MKAYENTFQDTTIGTFAPVDAEIQAYSDRHGILQGYDEEVHDTLRIFLYQVRGMVPNTPLVARLPTTSDDVISMACVEKPGEMRTLGYDTLRTAYGSIAMRPGSTDPITAADRLDVTWTVNAHATQRRWTSLLLVPAGHKVVENAVVGHGSPGDVRWYTREGIGLAFHCQYSLGTLEASNGITAQLNPNKTPVPARVAIPNDWTGAPNAKSGYRRAFSPSAVGYKFLQKGYLNGAGVTAVDFYTAHDFTLTLTELNHIQVSEAAVSNPAAQSPESKPGAHSLSALTAGQLLIDYMLPFSLPAGGFDVYYMAHIYHTSLEETELTTQRANSDKETFILASMVDHDERHWNQIGYSVNGAVVEPTPPPTPAPPVTPTPDPPVVIPTPPPPVADPLPVTFSAAQKAVLREWVDKLPTN